MISKKGGGKSVGGNMAGDATCQLANNVRFKDYMFQINISHDVLIDKGEIHHIKSDFSDCTLVFRD